MPETKQLWILTGGNGSGKTTFFNHYLAKYGIKFVNADLIAKDISPNNSELNSYEASVIATDIRMNLIRQGISFCYETVFSHESKIDFISEAKAYGYQIILVYIHLFDSSLNEARVFQRTVEGGHNVQPDKIHSRIPRTMKNIKTALTLVDEAWILDNSSEKNRFQQVFTMKFGVYQKKISQLPVWAMNLLPDNINI